MRNKRRRRRMGRSIRKGSKELVISGAKHKKKKRKKE